MLYGSTVEFKQKEMTVLNSNHSWTTWEIMTLYAFVKYAKEYWVYEMYKITNIQHIWLHDIDIQSKRLAENVLSCANIFSSS